MILWWNDGRNHICVMSQLMDQQPPSKTPLSEISRMVQYRSTVVALVDIWRCMLPRSKDFSFSSNRHTSYSSNDYFWPFKVKLYHVEDIEILLITISDHGPVSVGLKKTINNHPKNGDLMYLLIMIKNVCPLYQWSLRIV